MVKRIQNIRDTLLSQVRPARQVANTDDIKWHTETDVVVVGYGLAGSCAALEASAQGVNVFVLERLNGGGASALSGGIVYAGGGTRIQRQAGVEDSPDNMVNYLLQETAGVVSDEAVREFCNESTPNIQWLENHGVPFDSTTYTHKTSYPPNEYFLYYSGNELAHPYNQSASPAQRGHRVKGDGFTGRVLLDCLDASAKQQRRITIQRHCEATRLIRDKNNCVIGVEYRQAPANGLIRALITTINRLANRFAVLEPYTGTLIRTMVHGVRRFGKAQNVKANRGVILCAGGFIYNRSLIQLLAPRYTPARPLGENCLGLGISLGVSAGGQVSHMERVSAWRFFAPPNTMLKGIIVNERGQRICNEDLYGATVADKILDAQGTRAYLILDKKMIEQANAEISLKSLPWFQWAPARLFLSLSSRRATTLSALAEKCGIDAEQLHRTVETYNLDARNGSDRYHKATNFLKPIEQGPFFAVDVTLSNRRVPCFAITLGGLRVNETTGAVLDDQGHPISGLYAAGRNAVGICSNTYISGLSLADCVFSGRRAGRHAGLATRV